MTRFLSSRSFFSLFPFFFLFPFELSCTRTSYLFAQCQPFCRCRLHPFCRFPPSLSSQAAHSVLLSAIEGQRLSRMHWQCCPSRTLALLCCMLTRCALCAPVRYRRHPHTRLPLNSARRTETIRGRIAPPL